MIISANYSTRYKIFGHPRKPPLPAILALFLVASSAACTRAVSTKQPAVLVAAASDLRKVSQPLAAAFERSTGLRVTFSFASSGQLEQQIRRGAPFDVYAPAARSYCQSLERDGLADGEDRLYALGRLVAWSKTLQLSSLEELKESRVRRIAILERLAASGPLAVNVVWKSLYAH